VDRSKYRSLFIDEARENLGQFTRELIALEKLQSLESADPATAKNHWDTLFRAAHSLKGMGASMGYGPFADLAHQIEDLADCGRGGMALDAEAYDLLLEGADALESMVEQVADEKEESLSAFDLPERIKAVVAAIKRAPTPAADEPTAPASAKSAAQPEGDQVAAAAPPPSLPDGCTLIADVWLGQNTPAAGARAMIVGKKAAGIPGFLLCLPEKKDLTQTDFNTHPIQIFFGADAPPDDELGAKLKKLPAVDRVELKKPDAQATSAAPPQSPSPEKAPGPAPPERPSPSEPPEDTLDAQRRGKIAVQVRFVDGIQAPHVRAFMVYRKLSTLDGFLRSEPGADALRAGKFDEQNLRLIFDAAGMNADQVKAVVQDVHGVAEANFVDADEATEEQAQRVPEKRSPTQKKDERTVRIKTAILDDFIDSVGELLLTRSRLRGLLPAVEAAGYEELVDEVDRLTRDLHETVMAARMTPLSTITSRLPRVVRDISRKTNRPVDFEVLGAEIELDRAILDELLNPLIHMVRNAVDHGHEGRDRRQSLNKSSTMKLTLSASRDRDLVVITLKDDGGGIDPAKVKAKALQRGILEPHQAAQLSDQDAVNLVCAPGFSTAEAVSETSGRGVGMDVVKATLEHLGGTLDIRSMVGGGSTFIMRLPLTVAIIQVLVVEEGAGDASTAYAIPTGRVERSVELSPSLVVKAQGQRYVRLDGELVPLFSLARELGFEEAPFSARDIAVVVGNDEGHVALRVGRVTGQEEVMVKPLGRPLSSLDFIAGGTLLADGRAAFILAPMQLVKRHRGRISEAPEPKDAESQEANL
jgi:two-component system chemotaxis sensor kinase CheA